MFFLRHALVQCLLGQIGNWIRCAYGTPEKGESETKGGGEKDETAPIYVYGQIDPSLGARDVKLQGY